MKPFVEVRGTQLFFKEKPLRLRGFGVGSWLNMEHFMIGIPTPDSMIRSAFLQTYGAEKSDSFFNAFQTLFMQPQDFVLLKSCGVNFLRVPFNHRLLMDEAHVGQYREEGFAVLKRLLDLCEEYEIFCMPDLHTAPGGQNPDWHSDNRTGVPEFWEFDALRQETAKLWGEIARRFSEYSYLLGYDLLNEPCMATWDALNGYFQNTLAEIRKYDKHHAVVLEGDHFAMDFSGLQHFDDPQVILSFHYYPTVWEPDLLEKRYGRENRRKSFEEGLQKLACIREQFGRPVICGEAGYDLHPDDMPFCMELLSDTLELFEKYELNWAIWTYKDACFMGMVHPKPDSGWMKFVGEIKKSWTHYEEMAQADRLIRQIGQEFGGISEDLTYRMQFRLRGILYEMQQTNILLPWLQRTPWEQMQTLPDSFLLENSEVYPEYVEVMRRFTGR